MSFTCKDCENREPGCHAKCEKYKREKAKHDERKLAERKKKEIEIGLYKQRTAAVNKAERHKINRRSRGE